MWLMADTPLLVGTIDGTNAQFRPSVTLRADAVVYINGLARLPGPSTDNGYVFAGGVLQLSEVPVPGDIVAIWQPDSSAAGGQTVIGGPTPPAGNVLPESPTLGLLGCSGQGAILPPPSGAATILSPS